MWHFLRWGLGWVVSAICLLNCHCVVAQVSVAGTVVDPDGAAVPNASVVLKKPNGVVVNGGRANADTYTEIANIPTNGGKTSYYVPQTINSLSSTPRRMWI